MAQDYPIETPIVNLDFDGIQQSLKDYMKSTETFKDYNFEGSALAHLIDVLAYNTHYQAFYANMVANEMFLDTAVTRPSIVSLAKHLGYVPSSWRAAKAIVDVVYPTDQGTTSILPARSVFTARGIDGTSFNFTNPSAVSIEGFTAENVEIYEGSYKNFSYIVDRSQSNQKFIIPSKTIDTRLLNIRVQNSVTDTTGYLNEWELSDNVLDITDTSYAYWLQEVENGYFEVYFGDGILGRKVSDGNLIIIEYFETNGPAANYTGANDSTSSRVFTMSGSGGATVVVDSEASGGSVSESSESVRFYAPKAYQTQKRSVTVDDYETNIGKDYSNVESIYVWGGEDNDPPQYGKVFIAIKPESGLNLSEEEKTSVINSYVKGKSVVSITPEIVDPEYTYLLVDNETYFDPAKTKRTAGEIKALVQYSIINYGNVDLEKFNRSFLYTEFSTKLNRAEKSITNNRSKITMQKRFEPFLGSSATYEVEFRNAIEHPHDGHMAGVVTSGGFEYKKPSGEIVTAYIEDDGNGILRLYDYVNRVKTIFNDNIGTVDYHAGLVSLTNFSPVNIPGQTNIIKINAKPSELDIVSKNNNILTIDVSDREAIKVNVYTDEQFRSGISSTTSGGSSTSSGGSSTSSGSSY